MKRAVILFASCAWFASSAHADRGGSAPSPGGIAQLSCTSTAADLGPPGTIAVVRCPAGCSSGSAWGTDVYTTDSSVCTAARHAGLHASATGGDVRVTIVSGQRAYKGSKRNGVESGDWGRWDTAFEVSAVPAPDTSSCVSVSATKGWQTFRFERPVSRIASIKGGWSVDDARYARVGAAGHTGKDAKRLAPHGKLKFDAGEPFGALLIAEGSSHRPATAPMSLAAATTDVKLRINDADAALGDNGGALTVCFEPAPASKAPAKAYPQEVRDEFMKACAGGGDEALCRCVLHKLEQEVPLDVVFSTTDPGALVLPFVNACLAEAEAD